MTPREGEIPYLVPLADWKSRDWDYKEFDRAVCAAFFKHYCRPLSPADCTDGRPMPPGWPDRKFVTVVRELKPGTRVRTFLTVNWS